MDNEGLGQEIQLRNLAANTPLSLCNWKNGMVSENPFTSSFESTRALLGMLVLSMMLKVIVSGYAFSRSREDASLRASETGRAKCNMALKE